ncbi:MAG TPA: efflux RND transporter permease subunit, partial [Gemmatimonadaceae bacterium]|nr:efflux RND transporter permease subunit [Gemmatimonadaceae bacterium]
MQRGYNIVDFGRHVEERLHSLRRRLPPDLDLTVIANQPEVVDERIAEFMREFGMAIGSVILVTMFLLPLQVATIAALAIPVTVAVTFGTLNAVGIELHQVSLAALIVVLGMVVDDAIVIADNYVELLDHGVPRWDAAWRSASEMAIPVLTATLTIIASFLPLAFLSGATGEFILALPITVAVALACSLVVAMLLTPLLCYTFIKKGLHAGAAGGTAAASPGGPAPKRRFNLLDAMQGAYDRTVNLAMTRRGATMVLAAVAFLAGVGLFGFLPNRFFPPAERNQFVVDVWLPEGTRLEATDQVVRRLEEHVRAAKEVVHVAAFVGAGAPRFYYNFDPEPSTTNFG